MQNLEFVHNEKTEKLERIREHLKQFGHGKNKKIEETSGYIEPFAVLPVLYLVLIEEYQDENHRSGYSVCIDQQTFNVVSVSWFRARGEGTYRESLLTPDELADFKKYYAKYFKGLWSTFCNCILNIGENQRFM